MRRSEAIQALVETMGAYDSWREQCEYMLSQLEAIGMAPPEIETKSWNRQDNEYHKEREWENE
jgi:hypothetical protein